MISIKNSINSIICSTITNKISKISNSNIVSTNINFINIHDIVTSKISINININDTKINSKTINITRNNVIFIDNNTLLQAPGATHQLLLRSRCLHLP